MKDIAVLVPYDSERTRAEEAVRDLDMEALVSLYMIRTSEVIDRARELVNGGIRVLIARGLQSEMIRSTMNVPLVDISLTAQEIGLLIREAKQMSRKEHPVIALVIFKNSVGDIGHLAELLDVSLIVRHPANESRVRDIIEEILPMKPDVVIGGSAACSAARDLGIVNLLLRSTGESVRQALMTARQMLLSADMERMNRVQIDRVMDSAANGIIRINTEREITSINQQARQLLVLPGDSCTGMQLESLLPMIDMSPIGAVLKGAMEEYTTSVVLRNHAWQITVTAVIYAEKITGAIVSLRDLINEQQYNLDRMRDSYMLGYVAQRSFNDIHTENAEMRATIETAKRFSITGSPILIKAPFGTETQDLAEAIHLNSSRRSGPFVAVDISGRNETEQLRMVFGDGTGDPASCALDHAARGTLFIVGIDQATPALQHALKQILMPKYCFRSAFGSNLRHDVRIIGCANEQFGLEDFSEELYYLMCGLTLNVPSLRERPEDLYQYFRMYLDEACSHHNAHLHINKDIRECICSYPWPGNIPQVKRFCEALVLLRTSSHIDRKYISTLYERTYPMLRTVRRQMNENTDGSERQRILQTLQECMGNRSKAASILGMSTSTLWRKMKKLNI